MIMEFRGISRVAAAVFAVVLAARGLCSAGIPPVWSGDEDRIVRDGRAKVYIAPGKVLWKSSSSPAVIGGEDFLLGRGDGQAAAYLHEAGGRGGGQAGFGGGDGLADGLPELGIIRLVQLQTGPDDDGGQLFLHGIEPVRRDDGGRHGYGGIAFGETVVRRGRRGVDTVHYASL